MKTKMTMLPFGRPFLTWKIPDVEKHLEPTCSEDSGLIGMYNIYECVCGLRVHLAFVLLLPFATKNDGLHQDL